jgi:hypothetical protein
MISASHAPLLVAGIRVAWALRDQDEPSKANLIGILEKGVFTNDCE